jgi:Spy/CpxP family protein refolding chaperone
MKKLGFLGAAVSVLLTSASAVRAQGAPHGQVFGWQSNCTSAMVTAVGLSVDQQAALETLRQQTADAISAIVTQDRSLHDQIEAALAASPQDRCAIGDLVIAGYRLRQQVMAIVTAAEAMFVASLTADQKAKYTALLVANPGCSAISPHPGGPLPGF